MEKEILEDGGFNREDSGAGNETTQQPSSENKFKRPRIRRVENPRDDAPRPYTPRTNDEGQRRSFNPNFDGNNQRRTYGSYRQQNDEGTENTSRPRAAEGEASEEREPRTYGTNRNTDDRENNRPYNNEGGNRNYNNRPYNNEEGNRNNNNRPYNNEGGNRNYNNRPYNNEGGNRNYNNRPYNSEEGNRNYNNRPYNSEGGNRNYNNRPYNNEGGNRNYNNRPYNNEEGNRNYNNRPYNNEGGNRNYNNRPYNSEEGNRNYNNRPYNSEGGNRNYNNRPYNSEGGNRNYNNRPYNSEEGNRNYNNRPYNSEGGNRNYNNRPYNARGTQNYGDRRNSPRTPDHRGFKTPKGGFDSEYQPKVYPTFAPVDLDAPIRLNKYIAMSGLCSRREADEYIKQGLITVNGETVLELGVKISPSDEVRYNDILLKGEKRVYILMNKPKGFVTTVDDPNADRTVMDIVKNACQERIYPVGRLDKNSLGVLLITNDGELTTRLTHPSYEKKKIYQVTLDKRISEEQLRKLCEGIELEDGTVRADEVSLLGDSLNEVGIVIHSGRNRIVRRMFEHLGYQVQKLDRVYFAGLTKKGLRRGAWRYLTPKEVAMLKAGSFE